MTTDILKRHAEYCKGEQSPVTKITLRESVEKRNRRERDIPPQKSANVSSYQYGVLRALLGENEMPGVDSTGRPTPFLNKKGETVTPVTQHGSWRQEKARVLEAYAAMLRDGKVSA